MVLLVVAFCLACAQEPDLKPSADTSVPNGALRDRGAGFVVPPPIVRNGAGVNDDSEAEPPVEPRLDILRFVVLGDGGEGNPAQYRVSEAMETVCDEREGCEFALYLGDNFYSDGIDEQQGLEDPQFEEKFELPYANLDFPFFVVLGNHDYGVTSVVSEKASIQVLYNDVSDRWNMPDRYYDFAHGPAHFFALDTNAFMAAGWFWGADRSTQREWLNASVTRAREPWKIAFGHHPYISNGQHGVAGNFEGLSFLGAFSGGEVKKLMEDVVCDQVDIYFSGHDHNRQWLMPTCGTEWVVSGAAAKVTEMPGRGVDTFYEDDLEPGFMLVEIAGDQFTGEFYNLEAELQFARTFIRNVD